MDTIHIEITGNIDGQCTAPNTELHLIDPGREVLRIQPDGTWILVADATRLEIEKVLAMLIPIAFRFDGVKVERIGA